jgi:hypothetical protein
LRSKFAGGEADIRNAVTYKKLFILKFKEGYSTSELIQRFPGEADKVREIALLQVPTPLLKKTVPEEDLLEKILSLKRRFFGRRK